MVYIVKSLRRPIEKVEPSRFVDAAWGAILVVSQGLVVYLIFQLILVVLIALGNPAGDAIALINVPIYVRSPVYCNFLN